jgi:hypothetical protein
MRYRARCDFHDGKTPNSIQSAHQREATAVATSVIRAEVTGAVANPIRALQELADEALRLKNFFAERVSELEQLRYSSSLGFEQVRSEVTLYTGAMTQAGHLLIALAKLNLDDRLAEIDAAQGRQVGEMYFRALEAVPEITERQKELLTAAMANQLRHAEAEEIGNTLEVIRR